MRRASTVLLALTTASVLAGCGSDSSSSPTSPAPSSEAPSTAAASTSQTATSPAASSSAAPSSSAASSVGPAPAGSAIKSGKFSNLPATIGEYTKQPPSGSVTIYENADGDQIGVTFLANSKYKTIVTAITRKKTKAGTGTCGTDSDPTNATCYLAAADGVYNVSGDGVPVVVVFSNQLTAALGTS